uniref:KIB1-4 beta-propeller domain-containing protein n=1 Tax=Leersia perrieri TaxID=77586 RepID=A0A0D9XTE0_9ORYZ
MTSSETASARDWSTLPEDLILTAMSAMQIPNALHSALVCRSWHVAFATFRRLRLPSPPHPPCLLHSVSVSAAVYSPSTGARLFDLPHLTASAAAGVVGSAHGWLFTSDPRDANPYLVNPLTGERASLPPITTLRCVKGSRRIILSDSGENIAYDVDFRSGNGDDDAVKPVMAGAARRLMYHRVAISGACVVLLVHMPYREISFARPGDERWTSLTGAGGGFLDAVHNPHDGLFYLLQSTITVHHEVLAVHSLNLAVSPPVATSLTRTTTTDAAARVSGGISSSYYLATAPNGDHLVLAERRRLGEAPPTTMEIRLSKISLRRKSKLQAVVEIAGVALFLGHGGAFCLRVEDFSPMFRGNCAYLADDRDMTPSPCKRRLDLGVWDFRRGG